MSSSFPLQAISILHHSLYTHSITPSPAITHLFSKSDSTERICVTFTGFCNCLLWQKGCWSGISILFLRGNYENSEHSLLVLLEIHSKILSALKQPRIDYLFHCAVCRGSFLSRLVQCKEHFCFLSTTETLNYLILIQPA